MSEEFWMDSPLSTARFNGGITLYGHDYLIVNKDGKDIYECSFEAAKAGRKYAIEPGEPADLCRTDFIKYYKKLGRDKFLEVLKDNPTASDEYLMKIYKDLTKKTK